LVYYNEKVGFSMMKIECILRPSKVVEVKEALGNIGINGITVTEAIGCGLQKGHANYNDWDLEFNINFLPKTKFEMVVMDKMVDRVVDTIIECARTGAIGDGKIFIYPIIDAIRIRTGETGEKAI
jgi:nitrogen regulatory protein P-II 1